MPFRPDSLPFKIHRLVSSGVCSKQQLSSSSGVSQQAIDAILQGARPGPQTAHQLGKVLSYYVRQEHRHLRLETSTGADPDSIPPAYTRGVKEDLDAYDGTRGFSMRDRLGKRIFHCTMPAGTPETMLVEFLEGWLEELDPTIHLEPSSVETASST